MLRSVFKRDRVWGRLGPRGAPFWARFLAPFWAPFFGASGRRFLPGFVGGLGAVRGRCGRGAGRRAGGCGARALRRFVFASRLGRWRGAVRGVRALRGCAACSRGVLPCVFWRRFCFAADFFGARGAGVPLLRAPLALRFFLRARGASPGRLLVSFLVF